MSTKQASFIFILGVKQVFIHVFKNTKIKNLFIFGIAVFIIIFLSNLVGLLPFVFTLTS
jgi:hypothetical protein